MLAYLDASNTPQEIFVSPGNYTNTLALLDAKDWDVLSKFPGWSDQAALGGRKQIACVHRRKRGGAGNLLA